jgi:cysteine-rich repeat protein
VGLDAVIADSITEHMLEGHTRRRFAASVLFSLALAGTAAGQLAEPPRDPRIAPELARALERPLPAEGLAVAVTLRGTGLPPRGPQRFAAVSALQQRVLDSLPAGGLLLKHRYRSLAGFAGWMRRAAIEALAHHDEVETIYIDGRVHASLTEGVALIGAGTVQALGFTGAARRGCCPGGGEEAASAEDDEGHGTSVSAIITSGGAVAPTGVAPDAEIVGVKVLDNGGGGTFSDIAAGLDWVLSERDVPGSPVEGTQIVNMSLGDGVQRNNPAVSPCTGSNTANAIAALHGDGVAVFVASGNEGFDNGISFPACVSQAISVGGVYDAALGSVSWCGNAACSVILCTDNPTATDTFVCHSNSDEILDVLAPNWRTITSSLGGGTTAFGGTSAASPYAAAEAALLLEVNPGLTPENIRSLMKANGPQVTNPDSGLSFTRTDIGAAAAAAAPAVCGNGTVETGEDCDDGGTVAGDCCSATCAFEPLASPCTDGNACTDGDTCNGGGGCVAGPPLGCDDGLFCNGAETCAPASGCLAGTPPDLDDGVDCTADSCDEVNDVIVHAPSDAFCDDGLFCNGGETCDAVSDCQAGTPPSTSDGVDCTADSCDEVNDVIIHTPSDAFCDDGDDCTADSCDEISGCGHDPICSAPIPTTGNWGSLMLTLLLLATGAALLVQRGHISA